MKKTEHIRKKLSYWYELKIVSGYKPDLFTSIKVDYNKKPRKWLVSSYNLKKETPSQDLPGVRALEQTYASGQQISPPDLMKTPYNIIQPPQNNLNPSSVNTQTNLGQNLNQNNSIKPPKSNWEWLEWLKRKRKGLL